MGIKEFFSGIFGGGRERKEGGGIVPFVPEPFLRFNNSLQTYRNFLNMDRRAQEKIADRLGVALETLISSPEVAQGTGNYITSRGKAVEIQAQGQREATNTFVQSSLRAIQQDRIDLGIVESITRSSSEFVRQGIDAGERSLEKGQDLIDGAIHNSPNRTVTTTEEYRRGKGANPNKSQLKTRTIHEVDPKLPKKASAGRFRIEYPRAEIYSKPLAITSGDADARGTRNSAEAHSHGDSSAAAAGSGSIHIQGGSIDVEGPTIEY